ncbi:hypothetical protein B0A50_07301 [Salinomyces thailandicus]|uniref:Anaphase-promoting complex subunit 11 n=1 Tax=Salinomyces thailandicus TaxID=706561 RepID=A0A4U0TNU8_9PEZI|nr:hypothetical protein B0A50_07301 [Salinomyces thailandica]
MKVTFSAYHAVAEWKWDLPADADDTCGICRVEFEGTCSKCKFPGDDCPIIIGNCTHCFHMHCIGDWLLAESSQGKCPMCRQPFRERLADAAAVATPAGGAPRPGMVAVTPTPARTPAGR